MTSTGGTGAASRYSNWAKHSAKIGAKSKSKKKKRSAGGESSSVGETTEERDITEGGEDGGVGGGGGGTTDTDRAGSSRGKKDDVRVKYIFNNLRIPVSNSEKFERICFMVFNPGPGSQLF